MDQKILEAMGKLATQGSAAQVAQFLTAEGITGRTADAASCPVSNYIKRETGSRTIISQLCYNVIEAHYEWAMPTPTVVGEFVRRFDRGQYPALIRDWGA